LLDVPSPKSEAKWSQIRSTKEMDTSATRLVAVEVEETVCSELRQALVEQKLLGCSRAVRTSLDSQLCPSGYEASTPSTELRNTTLAANTQHSKLED
jgi:hypothetical protein